jgi:serine/threonine protein kinase
VKDDKSSPYDYFKIFALEARTLTGHADFFDNVLIESGQTENVAWNLLKWIEGERAAMLTRAARGEPQVITKIFSKITAKVADLHERGLLHRDLQPDHILIVGDRVALIDNSLCGPASDPGFEYKGSLIHFSAPEVARQIAESKIDVKYDFKSEIYSFGSTLFFMYTDKTSSDYGSSEFTKIPWPTLLDSVSRGPRDFASAGVPAFSKLEKILLKMMALNPAERYQDLRDAQKDLEDL